MTGDATPDPARLQVVTAPMRTKDLKGVLAIEEAVFPQPWTHRLFVEELAQRTSRAYRAAWVDRDIVGFAGLMFIDDEAHVNNIAVHPGWQGRSLGTAILLDLVRVALERGARHLTLEVRVGNEPALALYRRFGMAPVGVRRNYYPETGDDALVMWVRDIDTDLYDGRLAAIEASLPAGPGRHLPPVSPPAVGNLPPVGDQRIHRVLGIETSCDETAASVVDGGTTIVSSVVSSQIDLHARFGGVVPELAGRAHLELLTPVVAEALDLAGSDVSGTGIDGVAVTYGPGLIGSLLVGVAEAKALALAWDVPFVGVNHLEAHLFASLLEQPDLGWPLVVLLVSGGHTLLVEVSSPGRYRILGGTIDDAAGEAFDKVARFLGLGYPGGPAIDAIAGEGDPTAFAFPRALLAEGYDFSFSGLKTSVVNTVRKHPEAATADVAASFQTSGGRRAGGQGAAGGRRRRGPGPLPGRGRGGQLAAPPAGGGGVRRGRDRRLPPQPGPVHRQRRHGGGGGLVAAPERRGQPVHPGGRSQPGAGAHRLSWHSAPRGCQSATGSLALALATLEC